MATEDDQRVLAQMREDLGIDRREQISAPNVDSRGRPIRENAAEDAVIARIREQHRKRVDCATGKDADALKKWNSIGVVEADPLAEILTDRWAGQGHRADLQRQNGMSYNQSEDRLEGISEERAMWLKAKGKAGPAYPGRSGELHAVNTSRRQHPQIHNPITPRYMPQSHTSSPTSTRTRAADPRDAGTTRFVRYQPVATIQRGHQSPAAQHRTFKATTGQGNQFEKQKQPVRVSPAKSEPAPAQPRVLPAKISQPSIVSGSAPGLTAPKLSVASSVTTQLPKVAAANKLELSAFKDYVTKDMTFAQLQEVLKMIFDPARGQWLEKHRSMLQLFDEVGRTLRAGMMQITGQDDKAIDEFLKDFGFIPRISEHLQAAKSAIASASNIGADGGKTDESIDAYYERNPQYMPFYKMAQRMAQANEDQKSALPAVAMPVSLQGLKDTSSPRSAILHGTQISFNELEGLQLLETLEKNARAMLARSSMRPKSITIKNGIYVQC